MEQNAFFSAQEKVRLAQLYRELLKLSGNILYPDDCKKLKTYLLEAARRNLIQRNVFGMNPILNDMETALIVASEIGLTRGAILGIMVHTCVRCGYCTPEDVEREFGVDVAGIIKGLNRILELYEKNPSVESENFRSLLLSFAEDMRVVLIMIANRVNIMRKIKLAKDISLFPFAQYPQSAFCRLAAATSVFCLRLVFTLTRLPPQTVPEALHLPKPDKPLLPKDWQNGPGWPL